MFFHEGPLSFQLNKYIQCVSIVSTLGLLVKQYYANDCHASPKLKDEAVSECQT